MVDKYGRLVLQKELMVNQVEGENVYFYYAKDEGMFYMLFEKLNTEYLIGVRKLDQRCRVIIPKNIFKIYKTKNILLAMKNKRIYLIPLK